VRVALIAAAALIGAGWDPGAQADTLEGALAIAYRDHPKLNSQRAATRATDEGVAIARAGPRARVIAAEANRTDVAQVEARLAAARAALYAAQSQYLTSRASYLAAVGVEPGRLAWPRDCSPCVAVPPRGARRLDRSR
jgi:outer membrane protein